jgi:hypothetical protein
VIRRSPGFRPGLFLLRTEHKGWAQRFPPCPIGTLPLEHSPIGLKRDGRGSRFSRFRMSPSETGFHFSGTCSRALPQCPFRKTRFHFSGTCSLTVAACPFRKTRFHFSGTCSLTVAACPFRKTGFHFSGTCFSFHALADREPCAAVAQLVRAPDCGSGGRWFESTQLYQKSSEAELPQDVDWA